jgi:hypothetical protein
MMIENEPPIPGCRMWPEERDCRLPPVDMYKEQDRALRRHAIAFAALLVLGALVWAAAVAWVMSL